MVIYQRVDQLLGAKHTTHTPIDKQPITSSSMPDPRTHMFFVPPYQVVLKGKRPWKRRNQKGGAVRAPARFCFSTLSPLREHLTHGSPSPVWSTPSSSYQ